MACNGYNGMISTQSESLDNNYMPTTYNKPYGSMNGGTQGMSIPVQTPVVQTYNGNMISGQMPQTLQSPYYMAGYLKNYIGRDVRIEFLIGTGGPLVDRIGTLLEVGASYVVIRSFRTNDNLICDLFSIKFITIYDT